MREVAVLGAGPLGGAIADALARRDLVGSIVLIDDHPTIAAGKALDIMESAPIAQFVTRLSGCRDVIYAAGADVLIVADRANGAEWQGDDGLLLLRRLSEIARSRPTICAGASARELVERGVRELRFSRTKLFGSAPEALASAVRAVVALEADASPLDVSLAVLGVPPAQIVVPWEEATIGGFAVPAVLDGPARARLSARVARLWPPGPYALAAAAISAIATMLEGTNRTLSCFVAADDGQGVRARTAALPVRLNARGVAGVEMSELNARDRVALENATRL